MIDKGNQKAELRILPLDFNFAGGEKWRGMALRVQPIHRLSFSECELGQMSPTIFRERGYRFFFFSREEPRLHVHAVCADGEAKYWLDPEIKLAKSYRLSRAQLKEIEQLIEAHYNEIKSAWKKHFSG